MLLVTLNIRISPEPCLNTGNNSYQNLLREPPNFIQRSVDNKIEIHNVHHNMGYNTNLPVDFQKAEIFHSLGVRWHEILIYEDLELVQKPLPLSFIQPPFINYPSPISDHTEKLCLCNILVLLHEFYNPWTKLALNILYRLLSHPCESRVR